jgi:tellurite resistance-related uncharacterized protein
VSTAEPLARVVDVDDDHTTQMGRYERLSVACGALAYLEDARITEEAGDPRARVGTIQHVLSAARMIKTVLPQNVHALSQPEDLVF